MINNEVRSVRQIGYDIGDVARQLDGRRRDNLPGRLAALLLEAEGAVLRATCANGSVDPEFEDEMSNFSNAA